MNKLFSQVQAIATAFFWVVGFLTNPITFLVGFFAWFWADRASAMATLHTTMQAFISLVPNYSLNYEFVAQANRVVPLYESIVCFGGLLALRALATGVRWIKSWIPTVN